MLTFDPYDREYGLDPYPLYSRLRDEAPCIWQPLTDEPAFIDGAWIVTRFASRYPKLAA